MNPNTLHVANFKKCLFFRVGLSRTLSRLVTALDYPMKRAFQFRLSALLALTGVCALAAWLFLPHSPHVVYFPPMMTFSSDTAGTGYPEVFVELQNKGRYAVWYHGCSGIVSEFTIEGDLSKGQRHLHSLNPKHLDWICLAPGETAMLPIPRPMLFDTAKLNVEFRDWRNQPAVCTSQEFDFSSVPVNGVPGKGVQSSVYIPQGK